LYAAVLDRFGIVKLQIGQYDAANTANGQTRKKDRSEPRRHSPIPPDQSGSNDTAKITSARRKNGAQVSQFWGELPAILG
jgi:hypothetical protein